MADYDSTEALAGVNRFAVRDPAMVPSARYHDPAFYQLECEHLWPRVWQMACRLEQIPKVGDWVEYSNIGKSVIVVRTKEGVRAYHNHCRHRGMPLTDGSHGNCSGKGFICSFHGWRWNMDGENTFVYGRHLFDESKLDPAELALRGVRVETWGGCAFINHDKDAVSFRESMGDVLPALEARGMDQLRSEWWFATELPANWKIAMEAFMEGYHVMKTHPQLQQAQPSLYNIRYGSEGAPPGLPINPNLSTRQNIAEAIETMELLNSGMSGLVHAKEIAIAKQFADVELPEDPQQGMMAWYGIVNAAITQQLRARGEQAPDLNRAMVEHPVEAVSYLFPHYFLLTYFTSMASYRIRPTGPETCLFEIWSLTQFPEGEEPEVPMEPVVLPYDSQEFPLIPRQDYSNIPLQQKGLRSEGFEFMRLARNIEGLISNYQRLIDGYLSGTGSAKLAAATRNLGKNFDGAILDLGL
jgi:phenylpropionate dioxygenase-like ring-hydroxylating dioxygenase large terminal subunit